MVHAVTKTFAHGAVHRLVLLDTATHETRKIDLDAAGKRVAYSGEVAKAVAQQRSQFGKLTPGLHAALRSAPATSLHEVQIEHAVPLLPAKPTQPSPKLWAAYRAAVVAALRPVGDAVAAEIAAQGGQVLWRGEFTPSIEARLPREALLGALRDHPSVELMAATKRGQKGVAQSWASTSDLKIPEAFYINAAYFYGAAVKVGLTGDNCLGRNPWFHFSAMVPQQVHGCTSHTACDGVCLDSDRGAMAPEYCYAAWPGGYCAGQHQTMVLGMIGHDLLPGARGAPRAQIYFANNVQQSHAANFEWLQNQGVTLVNESWGHGRMDPTAQDRFTRLGMTVVKSASQIPIDTVADCVASNVLCVGAYSAVRSFWNPTATLNPTSCEGLGSGCDREVPDITFHGGVSTVTTSNAPSGGPMTDVGTSLAAGAATALVTLLQERWPSFFQYWPEVTRAALMASACSRWISAPYNYCTHDVVAPHGEKSYSDHLDSDEQDGAGVPDADRIQQMMYVGHVRPPETWTPTSFDSVTHKRTLVSLWLTAGQRVRAVLSWEGCPGYGVQSDFDLRARRVNSPPPLTDIQVSQGGNSYDNAYEIIEFKAPTTGDYVIEAQYYGWNGCPSWGGSMAVGAGFAYDVIPVS
ncbi:MAG: S8 family serine peptidase [Deltaproteobacteria bacterium]|nr:S8 family serine peptidase [Deltaproteobacteria bacterium]